MSSSSSSSIVLCSVLMFICVIMRPGRCEAGLRELDLAGRSPGPALRVAIITTMIIIIVFDMYIYIYIYMHS